MSMNIARAAFVLVSVVAVGAAAFRVSTASDRVKERRDTARSVCTQTGGQWVKVDNAEICRRDEPTQRI